MVEDPEESSCDRIISQFSRLVEGSKTSAGRRPQVYFGGGFNPSEENDRVDKLMNSCLSSNKLYTELWTVVEQLLLLSHGQASVERGFSVNKELSVENLAKEALIARRQITQHVKKCGGVHCVPVIKELDLSASAARNLEEFTVSL
ncbi:hypothetical protein ACOMHN_039390 [Nucella lapillus]